MKVRVTIIGGNRVCCNTQVRTDTLEAAVWQQVCSLLKNPQRLDLEYQRRGQEPTSATQENIKALESQITKLRRGIARLIDSYAEGLIEKNEFEPRIHKIKERVAVIEAQVKNLNDEATLNRELRLIIPLSSLQANLTNLRHSSLREIKVLTQSDERGLLVAWRSFPLKSSTTLTQTKPLVNAPVKNPLEEDLTEIEVTDSMHPLFGRRFAVISISTPPSGAGHAVVVYQGYMHLRIPLSATQLALPRRYLGTKLTLESVTELVTLATQCEVLCPSNQMQSGAALPRRSKKPSSTNSKPSSVR